MSFIGDILGEITGTNKAAKGAQQAADTQAQVAREAIAAQKETQLRNEQRQQPFVDAGTKALAGQLGLIGLGAPGSQQAAIDALIAGPEFGTAARQGEEAILANAAATGGLRGGNTNNSLARFRGDLVSSTIQNQFQRLGGLTSLGQNAAAGVGNQAIASTNAVSDLLQQQGAAIAGGQIARGNSSAMGLTSGLNLAKSIAGFF